MALEHVAPGEKVDLSVLGATRSGAKTSALVKTESFEAVHLVLGSGSTIQPHAVDGPITLQCLRGAVILEARDKVELQAGDWLYLDPGEQHGLTALQDSSLLLTIIFDRR